MNRPPVTLRGAVLLATLAVLANGLSAQTSRTVDSAVALLPTADTVAVDRFDQGRMWTFETPPAEYFRDEYGVEADGAWFERARLGALRIPGCSASFVSPTGLVLTNHHCARDYVSQVSGQGEGLLEGGFYANAMDDEREIEDFTADQLIDLRDVTDRMDDEVGDRTGTARTEKIDEVTTDLVEELHEEFGDEKSGIHVEVVALYDGARHSAYIFRRWTRATLVMAPSVAIGFFGGDADNFTYPRYNLDFSILRVRDAEGEPIQVEHWFPISRDGVRPGEPIFIVGNPGSTSRQQTVAELDFRQEVSDLSLLRFGERRLSVLEEYVEAFPDEADETGVRNDLFGVQNLIKATRGQLDGLADPAIRARLEEADRKLQAAIESDPMLAQRYGGIIDQIEALQAEKRELAQGYAAFLAMNAEGFESPTLHRALLVWQILNLRGQGAPIEYTADLQAQVDSVGDVPAVLDQALIEARLQDFIDQYGEDTRWVQSILRGRTVEGAAAVIHEGSQLADSASAAQAVRRGGIDGNDPALRVVNLYLPTFRDFQNALVGMTAREEELVASLGRARYAIHGSAVPPDATGTLRIADGVVSGYPYNGTLAPHVTTFFGMYDRHYAFENEYPEGRSPWTLPERWLPVPEGLDLSTAVNFVTTADIIGGNSGSPVLNADLEVVGVVFDGNIESLPGDYIFLPGRNRSVVVDIGGVLHALETVWQMDGLVAELQLEPAGITIRR